MASFSRKLCLISSLFTLVMSCLTGSAQAETKNGCIPGTYLVQEGSGTQSLWTFSADGAIHIASSAQGLFNFSDGLGAWKQTRSREVKAIVLDFNYSLSQINDGVPPASVARVDAVFSFSKKCSSLQGTFQLRFFDPETEDPLDINAASGNPISDTVSGRRVIPLK